MRIIKFSYDNKIKYGVLEDGDIKEIKGDIYDNFSIGNKVARLEDVDLLSPVEPPNIIAIGLNYAKHAEESGIEKPESPVVFLKATTSMAGPEDDIILPEMAPEKVDYEAELAVVIGEKTKDVEMKDALDSVLGYTCANDVSARDCQQEDGQWARAKSFDTFCPTGPWIETELNPNNCKIESILNGEKMQSSNTSDMIFNVAEIISYLSKNFTLLPGTLILTGTPEGVGFARKEPVFLRRGDEIEIKIDGIGKLKNKVI